MTLQPGPGMSLTLRMFSPCLPWSGSLSVYFCISHLSFPCICMSGRISPRVSPNLSSHLFLLSALTRPISTHVAFASLAVSASVFHIALLLSPSLVVVSRYFSTSWSRRPVLGPGHPSESAPAVFDDSWHSWLLVRLHAPSLHAPQLNRLRLWTLAGQRHGESGHFLEEPREGGGHP